MAHKTKKAGGAAAPGQPGDYLYIIADGKFFRLGPADVQKNPIVDKGVGDPDHEVFVALQDLKEKNCVVADLPGPGGAGIAASCVCVALNLDVFDSSLQLKTKS